MGLLVSGEMILAFKTCPADVAHESPLQSVSNEMLLQEFLLGIGHVTFGTTVQRGSVQGRRQPNLSRLRSGLLLLLDLLLFLLFAGGGEAVLQLRRIYGGQRVAGTEEVSASWTIQRVQIGYGQRSCGAVEMMIEIGLAGNGEMLLTGLLLDRLRRVLEEMMKAERQRRRRQMREVIGDGGSWGG